MPELRGDLAFVGLSALLRFIAGLGATGRLRVAGERGEGSLWLDEGHVVGAAFGAQRGAEALSALAGTAGDGRFRLSAEPAPAVREIEAPLEDVLQHVATMDAAFREIRPLLRTHWGVAPPEAVGSRESREASIVLDRRALDVLLAVNRGHHTVDEIAGAGNLVETAQALLRLRDQGLVQADGGHGATLGQMPAEGGRAATGGPARTDGAARPPQESMPRGPVPQEPMLEDDAVDVALTASSPATERRPADDVVGRFVPSTEWQEVPAGMAVPPGGEYRLELGGKVYARWPEAVAPAPGHRSR